MDTLEFDDDFITVNYVFRRPKNVIIVVSSFLFVILLGMTDFISGYEMSFSIFYLIPISMITFFIDYRFGILISIVSAVTWFIADVYSGHEYSNMLVPVWNTIMRLGYFLLHTFLLANIKRLYLRTKKEALTDQLTGASNTRLYYKLFEVEYQKAKRKAHPLTIVFFDLDNFKFVNDSLGHKTGDQVLKNIAATVQECIRTTDIFARLGGDEFSIIIPELPFDDVKRILSRIVSTIKPMMERNNWPITLSIGAVTHNSIKRSIEDMIKESDALMYKVKKSGKNNIEHILVD